MPSIGMLRGSRSGEGVLGIERFAMPRALAPRGLVLPLSRGRDDGGQMAPDPGQLTRRLERRTDAELLTLTPSVPEAFDVFYVRHGEAILAYVWRQTGNREVALDLTSEIFAAALASVGRFDPAKGDPRGWLFGIAKIKLLESYRRQSAEQSARERFGVVVDGYSDEDWEQAEARIDAALPGLVDGVQDLPPAERRAVVARVLEERDYSEIASDEDASEAAIRQRVKRGLGRLRERMGGEQR